MVNISNNIKLKTIIAEDHETLIKLMKRIYPPSYKHIWKNEDCNYYINKFFNVDNLKKELAEVDTDYYFVIFKKQISGIIRIIYNKPYDAFSEKRATYFHRIYLGEEAQGKGVAKQLFNWTEVKAKESGSELIWLKAMDTQQQALKFYSKQGFKVSGKNQLDLEPLHHKFRGMKVMHKIL